MLSFLEFSGVLFWLSSLYVFFAQFSLLESSGLLFWVALSYTVYTPVRAKEGFVQVASKVYVVKNAALSKYRNFTRLNVPVSGGSERSQESH